MKAKNPIPNPQGTTEFKWVVEGVNGSSKGIWELIVDPNTKTVWRLLRKSL